MSPMQSYCDESWKFKYPCSPGAEYYGRGALPIYWYTFLFYFEALDKNCVKQFAFVHTEGIFTCVLFEGTSTTEQLGKP